MNVVKFPGSPLPPPSEKPHEHKNNKVVSLPSQELPARTSLSNRIQSIAQDFRNFLKNRQK